MTAARALVAVLLCLPAAASAVIILSVPPVGDALPSGLRELLRPAAAWVFVAIAALPPESLAGRLFYGSFAPLPAVFGPAALAVHAALLGLPWAALALAALRFRELPRPGTFYRAVMTFAATRRSNQLRFR